MEHVISNWQCTFFPLDFTAKKALERSKKCDIPYMYAWDDPSSKDDVKFIVQALFNQVCD